MTVVFEAAVIPHQLVQLLFSRVTKGRMAKVVGESIRDGAVGFSTSRLRGHVIPDGRDVPGTHAKHDELELIAHEVGKHGGLMQNVLNMTGDFEGEVALLEREARASGGRVLFSNTAGRTEAWGHKIGGAVSKMRDAGLDINGTAYLLQSRDDIQHFGCSI